MPRQIIMQTLRQIEREFGCRILYACEAGSRAWGLNSPDSDFDIRFLYTHPPEWYLDIGQPPDTIEARLPDAMDLGGWELRKALRLLQSGNPALFEWLNSPTVYHAKADFQQRLQPLAGKFFKPRRCALHYLGIARNTLQAHPLRHGMQIKKLFYVIRPLLALQWVIQHRRAPPSAFDDLLSAPLAPSAVLAEIASLRIRKQAVCKAEPVEIPHVLEHWIDDTLQQAQTLAASLPLHGGKDHAALNGLMRDWVLYENGYALDAPSLPV